MSANIRIIAVNDADAATLTASPALVATLPASNLQDPTRARVTRTTSTASQQIKGAWSSARIISALALVRHNLSASATWRLQLYSDAAWTTQVYDSGALPVYDAYGWGEFQWGIDAWCGSIFTNWTLAFSTLWLAPIGAQSFTLTLADASNPAGYMEASRLFLGNYFEPLTNMNYGVTLSWKENSQQTRTDGGTLRTDPKEPYRAWKFDLKWLDATERTKLTEMFRRVGLRKDVFISCYPAQGGAKERDYAGVVKLIQMPEVPHDFYNNWSTQLVFEES